MQRIVVNTRILSAPLTGTRRYTEELLARWNGNADTIAPRDNPQGVYGHAWEQFVVPSKLGGRLLFSPSNTGPIKTKNQVVTIHDMAAFDCPGTFSRRFAAWYQFLLPRVAREARHIITVSEFIKARIVKHAGVRTSKITVIPNGIGSCFCPAAASQVGTTIRSLGLPSRDYILVVGSVEPRKNVGRLLRAWAMIQGRLPGDLWLVIVGAFGNSRVFAKAQIDSIPARVHFAGPVDDRLLPSLYAGAIALAYISLYEGFGLPALEAMASGTPVLAGKCSSLPEVVGNAAVLVDPLAVEDIGLAMVRIVEDVGLRRELRTAGLERAKQYSWDEAARKTWDVLQKAAVSN